MQPCEAVEFLERRIHADRHMREVIPRQRADRPRDQRVGARQQQIDGLHSEIPRKKTRRRPFQACKTSISAEILQFFNLSDRFARQNPALAERRRDPAGNPARALRRARGRHANRIETHGRYLSPRIQAHTRSPRSCLSNLCAASKSRAQTRTRTPRSCLSNARPISAQHPNHALRRARGRRTAPGSAASDPAPPSRRAAARARAQGFRARSPTGRPP